MKMLDGGSVGGPDPEFAKGTARGGSLPTSRKRILLVDDDTDVLVTVGGFLEAEKMDVVRVSSGAEAVALVRGSEPIDAVVTDFLMPGMSGAEFLVAARGARPSLPALIITGYFEAAAMSELPANVAVLRKPFRRKEFISLLRELVMPAKSSGPR